MQFSRNGKCQLKIVACVKGIKMFHRAHTVVLVSVKSSSILVVGKRNISMTYGLVKNLGNLHQKSFSLQNSMLKNEDWKKNYNFAGKVTIDIRIRVFQYKILNNILHLNRQLFRVKIADSSFCSSCRHSVETVTHLVLSCTVSQGLWDDIIDWSNSCILLPKLTEQIFYVG